MRGEFGDVRVLAKLPPTLCNGGTTLGDQQAHVSLLHPAEECPQLDVTLREMSLVTIWRVLPGQTPPTLCNG